MKKRAGHSFAFAAAWLLCAISSRAHAEATPDGDLKVWPRIDPEVESLSRAMEALQRGRLHEALAAIDNPRVPDVVLRDYRAWVRARILIGLGEREKARAALAVIPDGPPEGALCKPACRHPLAVDLAELTAKTYELSAPRKAAELLAALPPDGRLWKRAIELYRRAGDEKQAQGLEERLLVEAAESPEAHELAEALGHEGVSRRVHEIDRRRARVLRLLDTHDNAGARREAEVLTAELPKNSPLACDLAYASGKASRKLHDYGQALAALTRARRECSQILKEKMPGPKAKSSTTAWAERHRAAEDHLLRSTLLETEVRAIKNDTVGAKRTALLIADQHPQHPFADDALFYAAEILEQRGLEDEALAFYQRILQEHSEEELAAEASWRIGFLAVKRGDRELARGALAKIIAGKAGETIEGARARYWMARLTEDEVEHACAAYEEAALRPALTFYAWLAVDRLERFAPQCAERTKSKLSALRNDGALTSTGAAELGRLQLEIAQSLPFARAQKLSEVPGFKPYAGIEIGLLRREGMSETELVALALAYDAVAEHRMAQLVLRKRAQAALTAFPRGSTLLVWRAAYSRPFEEQIEHAAAEQKIDPWLLYALAREESTFDPAVISWAGAVGLAQLMPATARALFPRLKLGRFDRAKLVDPLVNMRLGATVLREGLRRFGSSVPLALVAYNGGVGLAAKNLPEAEEDFDLWVETIPVKETRKYVKRVIQTYGIYRFLYDRVAPYIDLPDTVRSRRQRAAERASGRGS
jgi:peptidoglycan lytic transglycosylase